MSPLEAPVHTADPLVRLVGSGRRMTLLRERVRALAGTPTTVLVTGETGTGKSEVARALHAASPRSALPFVHVDCAALAASLFESELFGHEAGAFTGAVARRRGRLEEAAAGTLFLDEIGEIPRALQAKLLRVLQERRFERVGGGTPRVLRARIVAATNADLGAAVRIGRFRADLYYRLDVVRLHLPPLRERPEDLADLVAAGLARLCGQLGVRRPDVTPDFLARFAAHDWPGNVRELLNALERLLVLDPPSRLTAAAADAALAGAGRLAASAASGLARGPADDEAQRIATALRATGGNVARAARHLGLSRSALRRRMARHGLVRPADPAGAVDPPAR